MDTTPSVLDALEAQLGPHTIQKLSERLGTNETVTSHAVSMAVPILLGRLSNAAADKEGAAALDTALNAHDGGVLDNLGVLLGNGSGAAILGHILGSRRAPVEEGVARATGLNASQVGNLLTILAPLVMGVLGRMKRQQSVSAEQLPVVLGQANLDMARQSTGIGDLSRLLDSNEDGHIADDIARIGSTVLAGVLGPVATS